jgi:hypothetical protein
MSPLIRTAIKQDKYLTGNTVELSDLIVQT